MATGRRGEMKMIHKKAAHLLLCGLTPRAVAKELNILPSKVEDWTYREPFVKYMQKLEEKYAGVLDREVVKLRRNAYHVLQDALTSNDMYHKRWAVNTILRTTETKETTVNINQKIESHEVLSESAKQAAKMFFAETEKVPQSDVIN